MTGALPVGASSLPGYYWCRSSHGPPLSGPFFGLFWLFAGFGSFGLLGCCPYSCPSGLLGRLAWAWPGLLFFGICACLGFWPFCFGLCGRAWPSGGGFVSAATLGGWLPFVFVALLVGIWLVVAPVVTSRDAFLFWMHSYCYVANRAPLSSFL